MKLNELKPNPENPRFIDDDKFEKLCNSIKSFPKMMELRPIIIDDDNIILGGNMRYKALKELGYTEIDDKWVKKVSELTPEQKKEFIIKDNSNFGEWDFEILNEWNKDLLIEWGILDIPGENMFEPTEFSEENRLDQKKKVTCPNCGEKF